MDCENVPDVNSGDQQRVAQIIYAGLGGHGSVAFSLISADTQEKWRSFIGFYGIEPPTTAYLDFCAKRGIPHEYFGVAPGKAWLGWRGLFEWLKASRPTIIIVHSATALPPCIVYARTTAARVIVVEHHANHLKKSTDWLYSIFAMIFASAVVCLTPAYASELKGRLGSFYRSNKVSIIPNGIDIALFTPRTLTWSNSKLFRMGMAARFTRTKRHDVLVETLAELREKASGVDWRLSLPGEGETLKETKERVILRGLTSAVEFPGHLNEIELSAWYRSLDLYVHATDGETLSTAILQAMASGLPIVASNVVGMGALLDREDKCGRLVDAQSADAFVGAVQDIQRDVRGAIEMGKAGRRCAERDFNEKIMFFKYEALADAL